MFSATFDHPYWGELTLTGSTVSEILTAAMKYDHDCEDTTGCDVANMTAGGFLLVATHRMFGSTECPTLQAVWDVLPDDVKSRAAIERDENEWWDTVKDCSVFCPHCGSLLHGERTACGDVVMVPEYCTNCAESFDPDTAETPSGGR